MPATKRASGLYRYRSASAAAAQHRGWPMTPPDDFSGQVVPMPRRAQPTRAVLSTEIQNPLIVALDLEARRIADDFAARHFTPPYTRLVTAALEVCALRNVGDADALRRARRTFARIVIAQESRRP